MSDNISVFDCDGHIIESIPEMVPFLDPVDREVALHPSRNRQGVFASLDDMHYPRNVRKSGEVEAPRRQRVDASNHRKGSGEDWVAFWKSHPLWKRCCFLPRGFPWVFSSKSITSCGFVGRSTTMYPNGIEN